MSAAASPSLPPLPHSPPLLAPFLFHSIPLPSSPSFQHSHSLRSLLPAPSSPAPSLRSLLPPSLPPPPSIPLPPSLTFPPALSLPAHSLLLPPSLTPSLPFLSEDSLPLSPSPLPPSCSLPHSSFQKTSERTRHKILKKPPPAFLPYPSPHVQKMCERMRHKILKYTQHLRHRYLFLSFNIIKVSAPPLFWTFCAPGLVNQLGTSFFFPICFLDDSSPHLASRLDVHGDNIAFNAHQCPPMPTNAHPMPIKIALQCPSNALNDLIPYRSCFVRGSSHRAQ